MKKKELAQLVDVLIAEGRPESVAQLVDALIAEGPESVAQAQRVIAYLLDTFPRARVAACTHAPVVMSLKP